MLEEIWEHLSGQKIQLCYVSRQMITRPKISMSKNNCEIFFFLSMNLNNPKNRCSSYLKATNWCCTFLYIHLPIENFMKYWFHQYVLTCFSAYSLLKIFRTYNTHFTT